MAVMKKTSELDSSIPLGSSGSNAVVDIAASADRIPNSLPSLQPTTDIPPQLAAPQQARPPSVELLSTPP